ncbi:MAG: S1/P1 nuclease [Gammaproteobacteria bacterium]|nr:S1/P1 nuclease [Gammaproteobacteria bacterium]
MSRSPLRTLLPLLFVLLLPAEGLAWGRAGHRVTGALAERWLSPQARAAVLSILGRESLAEASTWADEMRCLAGNLLAGDRQSLALRHGPARS